MTLIAETPFRTGKGEDLASQALPGWEQVSAEAGVVGGAEQWEDRLERFERDLAGKAERAEADGDPPARVRRLENLRLTSERLRSFVGELARRAPPESGSWRDYAAWAAGMLEDYAHDPARWPESEQSYDRVKEAIESLADADKPLTTPPTSSASPRCSTDCSTNRRAGSARPGVGVFARRPSPLRRA